MFIILTMFKLGKATANFAHWSHADWGFNDWNRSALIKKLIFKGKRQSGILIQVEDGGRAPVS